MKLYRFAFILIAGALMAACGNLNKVTAEGIANEPQLIWPKPEDAHFGNNTWKGSWPNWDNVAMLELGMSKAQISQLIGPPHFSEGFIDVREWNYLFNYKENDQHKTCQLKVLFDSRYMSAQSILWKPQNCHRFTDKVATRK